MILAIDANNILHRSFHAVPPMKAPNGTPNNALRGFLNSILNLQEQIGATHIICAFDAGIPLIRRHAVPAYKANRPPKDESLTIQLKIAQDILTPAMGWGCISEKNVEADDILYTLCLRAKERNRPIAIASGDKDTAQCLEIDKNIILLRPPKNTGQPWNKITPSQVKDFLGVEPHQVADFLAIQGDSSDNLAGVKGAGPATATKWLNTYGSIQGLLKARDTIEPARFRDKLNEDEINANLLITKSYDTGHTIPDPIPQSPDLQSVLEDLGLFKLISRVTKGNTQPKAAAQNIFNFLEQN